MAADFGFQVTGYIEPKPGIPPSAAHIERLIEDMKNSRPDGILTTGVFGMKEARALIFLSYKFDVPTAPVIVVSLSIIFFVFLGVRALVRRNNRIGEGAKR